MGKLSTEHKVPRPANRIVELATRSSIRPVRRIPNTETVNKTYVSTMRNVSSLKEHDGMGSYDPRGSSSRIRNQVPMACRGPLRPRRNSVHRVETVDVCHLHLVRD